MTDLTNADLNRVERGFASAAVRADLVAAYRALRDDPFRARVAEGTGGAGQGEPAARLAAARDLLAGTRYVVVNDDDLADALSIGRPGPERIALLRDLHGDRQATPRAPGAVAAAPPADENQAAVEPDGWADVHEVETRLREEAAAAGAAGLTEDADRLYGLATALAAARAPGSPNGAEL